MTQNKEKEINVRHGAAYYAREKASRKIKSFNFEKYEKEISKKETCLDTIEAHYSMFLEVSENILKENDLELHEKVILDLFSDKKFNLLSTSLIHKNETAIVLERIIFFVDFEGKEEKDLTEYERLYLMDMKYHSLLSILGLPSFVFKSAKYIL
jgi:hypothetical protein